MPKPVVRLNTNVPKGDVIKHLLPREGCYNISGDMRGVQKCNVCGKVFRFDSTLAEHIKPTNCRDHNCIIALVTMATPNLNQSLT